MDDKEKDRQDEGWMTTMSFIFPTQSTTALYGDMVPDFDTFKIPILQSHVN
jgi:hypothetical protein